MTGTLVLNHLTPHRPQSRIGLAGEMRNPGCCRFTGRLVGGDGFVGGIILPQEEASSRGGIGGEEELRTADRIPV